MVYSEVLRIACTWIIDRKIVPAAAITASTRPTYRGIVKVPSTSEI